MQQTTARAAHARAAESPYSFEQPLATVQSLGIPISTEGSIMAFIFLAGFIAGVLVVLVTGVVVDRIPPG